MANVVIPVSVTIRDALGVVASLDTWYECADTVTLAVLNTWANTYLTALDPITDGQIISCTAKVPLTLPGGLKSAPASTAEVERTGLFNFSQAGVKYANGIDVPAFADAKIVGGKINLSDTDVQNWINFLKVVTSGLTPVSKFVNALVALIDALLTFRKHRRAETRRSFEIG